MRLLALLAALLAACVSVEPLPDPRGILDAQRRLVVLVYQSPGPWIIKEADSKAEAAAKITPMGFLVQTVQDDRTLETSKDLQQYLPRPRYDRALEGSLIQTFKTLHSGPVQTPEEAGLSPVQLREWNRSRDQLEWRRRYYAPETGPAPRDYSKVLSLDDAVILEINLSFGTEATDEGQVLPALSASARAYRADTSRLLWSREDIFTDKTSSATLAEFKLQPWELTQRLEKLAPGLGEALARSAAKALVPATSTPPATANAAAVPSPLPYGLTPADMTGQGSAAASTAPVFGVDPSTPASAGTGDPAK